MNWINGFHFFVLLFQANARCLQLNLKILAQPPTGEQHMQPFRCLEKMRQRWGLYFSVSAFQPNSFQVIAFFLCHFEILAIKKSIQKKNILVLLGIKYVCYCFYSSRDMAHHFFSLIDARCIHCNCISYIMNPHENQARLLNRVNSIIANGFCRKSTSLAPNISILTLFATI